MSKIIKRVAALLFAVALIVPTFVTTFANDNEPNLSLLDPERNASITINRIAGTDATNYDVTPPVAPAHAVSNVPVRIRQVEFAGDAVPSQANLLSETWRAANLNFVTPTVTFYGITDANGQVTFPLGTNHGFWLVEELPSLVITAANAAEVIGLDTGNAQHAVGQTITNPVPQESRFNDFVVAAPRWIPDTDHAQGGTWQYDINAWPKSPVEELSDVSKSVIEHLGGIATWELASSIPTAIGTVNYFSVTDLLPSELAFITGSVVGRFTHINDLEGANPVTDWDDVTGVLTAGTHFTVDSTNPAQVVIALTAAGHTLLAENGLLGAGEVMFRFDTAVNGVGTIYNEAVWRLGVPPTHVCTEDDPACNEDDDYILSLNLDVLKLNVAEQPLAGAVFNMYRTLTAAEAALTGAAFTALGATEITVDGETFYVVPLLRFDGTNRVQVAGTTAANGRTNFEMTSMSSYNGADLWLREITPPEGYRVIQEWMPVTVNMTTQRVVEGDNTYITHVTVYNEPVDGWQLPQTGGIGTIILTIVGIALVGGALVLFIGGKEDEESA